jgi:acetone carboxylase gamma subunit
MDVDCKVLNDGIQVDDVSILFCSEYLFVNWSTLRAIIWWECLFKFCCNNVELLYDTCLFVDELPMLGYNFVPLLL